MTNRSLLLLTSLFGLSQISAFASDWRSELYPENWTPPGEALTFDSDLFLQDFSHAGYKSGEQPIPFRQGPILNVVTDYQADPTGKEDSTVAIQNAIDDAGNMPDGGVVYLPAGDYRISLSQGSSVLRINKSNVVLRGAGEKNTRLINHTTEMREKTIILVMAPGPASSMRDSPKVPLTQDITSPTTKLHVKDASGFAVGDLIEVSRDFTYDWIKEHGQTQWWGVSGDPDPKNPDRAPRPATYPRIVTAVDPEKKWIEVGTPIRYTVKTRDNASVYKLTNRLSGCGIENLSLGNKEIAPKSDRGNEGWGEEEYRDKASPAGLAHQSMAISFRYAYDSWIVNVASVQHRTNETATHILSNGIRLKNCFHMSVLHCTIQNPQYGGGGRNGYMFDITNSAENLIAYCHAINSRHGFVLSGPGTSGNVFYKCTDTNTARAVGNETEEDTFYKVAGEGSDTHNFFTHSNLWDSCHVNNSRFEAFHRRDYGGSINPGSTSSLAVFWNTTGEGDEYNHIVISDQYGFGYVIGTSGETDGVKTFTSNDSNHAPQDHVEGVGTGDELTPRSLWQDQRRRRLGKQALVITSSPTNVAKSE